MLSYPRSRSSRFVRLATVAYLLLTVYASLYPFRGWRVPNSSLLSLLAGPTYNSTADLVLNVAAYVPLGMLLTLSFLARFTPWRAILMGLSVGALLSSGMELLQGYLPTRVPSMTDIGCNVAGALIGAMTAVVARRSILSGRLYDYRRRVFSPDMTTDLGFLLLGFWAITQLNPDIWLFGNGDIHAIFQLQRAEHYSAPVYAVLEAGVAASGYCALILLSSSLARPRAPVLDAILVLTFGALALKSIATAFLFNGGHLWLWVTPGSSFGLLFGAVAGGLLSRAPQNVKLTSILICLAVSVVMVNLAPANPYLAVLQVWQHGHYASFNATTRLLASVWPFVAAIFVLVLMLRRPTGDWTLRSLS